MRTIGSSAWICFVVNARATADRKRVWSGGSVASSQREKLVRTEGVRLRQ
ncbi:MAG: hypothetical protein ACJAR2_001183 [Ilumatobacter sp.]